MDYRGSVYTGRLQDKEAVYLGTEAFPAFADGIHDDTENIRRAVNYVKKNLNFGIVFMPEGEYLISDTVYMPQAVRLIGYGKNRPEIVLQDHAPGYDVPHPENKSGGKEMLWFVARAVEKPEDIIDANPGTFYSALSNVDLRIGEGNPYAVALRTHYAQHSFINHCVIRADSGLAGMYDAGNEMENVHFIGGDYGVITTKCSPGWPFMVTDCSFTGQRKAGMYTRELGLAAIRTCFRDVPKAIESMEGFMDKIYLEDCTLENISEDAFTLRLTDNAFTQWNVINTACANVPKLAYLADRGERLAGPDGCYVIDRFTHGVVLEDMEDLGEIRTELITHPTASLENDFACDIPLLPDVSEWANVQELGAKGDNEADDTAAIQAAIDAHRVVYFPQGWYKVTDTLKLKDNTILIGLNPISTQLKLPDNTEVFGDLGPAKALVESGTGANVVNGLGIDSGARNPRAVGLRWIADEKSYINDVKFIGGHGSMTHDTTRWVRPYNDSRTADADPARKWDVEYWSFWVDGGGGVFKDVWSASTYNAAGFYASDTCKRGRIYCMSVEHHVRNEVKFKNVANWKVYALQTEEEIAESQQCLPLEVVNCRDMTFATYYSFRVIWLPNPYPTAIRVSGNENVEWMNFHNYTQVKYTLTNGMIDTNARKEIRPWQIARYVMKGYKTEFPALKEDGLTLLYSGFEFADGAVCGPDGDLWFVDGRYNRIYRLSAENGALTLVRDVPQRPLSLFFDTKGNLIVVTEFSYPFGATKNGEVMKFTKPGDAKGTSYGDWYVSNNQVKLYTMDPADPEHTMRVLQKTPWAEITDVAQTVHPSNRWRDDNTFLTATLNIPDEAYVCPDGVTVVPDYYDLIRSMAVYKAVPGKKFYAVDEYYKRVISYDVKADGLLENPEVFLEHGEYSIAIDEKRNVMVVPEGDLLFFGMDGKLQKKLRMEKRPVTVAIGGKDGDVLFVTAEDSVYAMKL
ncbi:MAG: SMP-30/gluconolactonase/LRE family protein [Lachnospiraceae bacterium]|nr:SMP-30/gluconolactonase/LRE family protein [Lachnospiraceae bacterium]